MDSVLGVLNLTRPLVSPLLVTDACFDTLVMDLDVLDAVCVKQALSKAVGYAIILFATILKLPLVLNILRSKSVAGLSTSSVYLETTMYAAVLAYHTGLGSPFSTYGEKWGLVAQNVVISALIWRFAKKSWLFVLASAAGFVGVAAAMASLPADLRHYLILYTSVGACASRLPQIYSNFTNGHTGVLSQATLVSAVVGPSARLFTVLQEVDDAWAALGEIMPLALNAVILAQLLAYKAATKAHFDNDGSTSTSTSKPETKKDK